MCVRMACRDREETGHQEMPEMAGEGLLGLDGGGLGGGMPQNWREMYFHASSVLSTYCMSW